MAKDVVHSQETKDSTSRTNKTVAVRLLWVLFAVTAFLIGVHLLLQYVNLNVYYQQNGPMYELSNRFDLDDEASVPTWFSQMLFAAIGLSALVAAWLHRDKALRRLWMTLGLAGFALSIDEGAALHEFVLQTVHVLYFQDARPTGMNNAWWIILPFVLVVFAWLSWKIWRMLPRRTFIVLTGAGILFLFGAAGIDLATSISERETFLNQGLYVAAEESLELLGAVMVLYGIVDYIERSNKRLFQEVRASLMSRIG